MVNGAREQALVFGEIFVWGGFGDDWGEVLVLFIMLCEGVHLDLDVALLVLLLLLPLLLL